MCCAGAGLAARQETELWVDKYSPKSFLELLSDEVVNRSVVRWLKSWDVCVFGGDPKLAASGRASGAGSTAKQRGESRPEQRILLISGAPGTFSLLFFLPLDCEQRCVRPRGCCAHTKPCYVREL